MRLPRKIKKRLRKQTLEKDLSELLEKYFLEELDKIRWPANASKYL
jgi:predicted membrane chloride channel (bestrophin family)